MPNGELPFVEVSPSSLAKLTDREVLRVHARFVEGWQSNEAGRAGRALPGGLNIEEFVNRFAFVVAELEKREVDRPDAGTLDDALARLTPKREADRPLPHALDRIACDKLLSALPDEIVLVHDYARLAGSFLSDEDGEEVDVLLRDKTRDSSRDLKLSRIVQSATNRVPGFQLKPDGFAESSSLPGYDLVLRKSDSLEMNVLREPEFQARIYGSMREIPERLTERRAAVRDALVDFVCVPQFVSVSGSFVYHDPDREPDDIDVVVKSGEVRDDLIETIGNLVREATGLDPHFVWEPRGPNWTYWPAYDLVCRVSPDRPEGQGLSEAFHLRGTHWIEVPESGTCPVSHPVKARFPGKQKQVCFRRSAAEAAAQARMREQAPVKIPEAEVNLRPKDFPTMKCALCRYFIAGAESSAACKIVTRAEPELVCDAYQGAERKPSYEVADEDWLAFVRGMKKEQPYSHIVQRGFLTPEGPIVIIRDTMKPKPHVFSLSKAFHLEHTGQGEHAWQQDEVDRIIAAGGESGIREAQRELPPNVFTDLEGVRKFSAGARGKRK